MTDVLLFQTDNDGDIEIVGGLVTLTDTLETMAYLCLFGGNEQDDGREQNPATWWGNVEETDPDRRYISETQFLLRSLPAVPFNLRRIEDAVRRDLAVFITSGVAKSVDAVASIPGLNRVLLIINIDDVELQFAEPWELTA